jgi:hypothetical protein
LSGLEIIFFISLSVPALLLSCKNLNVAYSLNIAYHDKMHLSDKGLIFEIIFFSYAPFGLSIFLTDEH